MPKIRLFCLPYAGGSSLFYGELKKYLRPEVELCAIDLKGHGMRMGETPNVRMKDAIDDVCEQVRKVGTDWPFALLGYSMGSTLAYHLFFRLREQGLAPKHIFFMANTPPYVPDDAVPSSQLDDAAFLEGLSALGGLPQELLESKELLNLFLPIMRADVQLEEGGAVTGPAMIDCDMTIVYSSQDDQDGQMKQWRRCAGGSCDFHRFEGTHFFMLDHYAEVAEIINCVF